ncbi:MAG: biotin--[acetyl-CoA-carboxylase] ligase [Tannerella sp.]|jgi:BirA family biotin operon repressor/biotin-[acetyl-CoA-carboxylase] ligase|nr:biotin--[acetyl-CoA-carboxylase] ligase [Tannerella sp.]
MKEVKFIHLKETDSTNRLLQLLAEQEDMPAGSIVLADYQTSGRGQQGNSWVSEAGMNLTFSVLLKPESFPASRFFSILETVSLSVRNVLMQYVDNVTVKWSNDIYCHDRKISGILIENTIAAGLIVKSVAGIGINVNQTQFGDGAPNAVSLAMLLGKPIDCMEVMERFQHEFARQYDRLTDALFDEIHTDYRSVLYRKDGFHPYRDVAGVFDARIADIEPGGILVLERADGTLSRYAFKEVGFV